MIPSQIKRNVTAYNSEAAAGSNHGAKTDWKMIALSGMAVPPVIILNEIMALPAIEDNRYAAMAFLPKIMKGMQAKRNLLMSHR